MIIEEDNEPPALPNGYEKTAPSSGVGETTSHESHESLGEEPAVDPDSLPPAHNPTVALLIPFPQALHPPSKKNKKVPPFMMYAPLAAPLPPKTDGEKEGITTKAARRWQKEEKEAREKGTGFKAKAVKLISKGMSATKNSRIEFLVRTPNKKKLKELRFVYPTSWPADNVQQEFAEQVKSAKKGAIMNGVIATSLAPFALAFDTLTFIPGPFEITAVWSASSWTGAVRASGIAKRITSSELPISFSPNPQLEFLRYRLHQLCWEVAKRGTVNTATWNDTQTIKRGPELASVVLEVMREFGEDINDLETNKSLIAKDLDRCMRKAAKEWAKAAV